MKTISSRLAALCLGCAVVGATPLRARAEGFYVGVQSGATLMYNTHTRASEPTTLVSTPPPQGGAPTNTVPPLFQSSASLSTNADTGWLAGASGGYEWPIGLALEGEFTFRQNHLDRMSAGGTNYFTGGDEHSYAMMLNGYYRWHNSTRFTPYIGGGIGEAVIALNNLHPSFGAGDFGGDDATFAYQGIGGIAFAINEHVSLAAEYRYFAALDPSFTGNSGGSKDLKLAPGYRSNNALLRLNYTF